jgi:hypothetical protein
MRTKGNPDCEDEAGRKCFFCSKPVDDDAVLWLSSHSIVRNNRLMQAGKIKQDRWFKGPVPTNSNSIVLHPDCAIQLGKRLMADGRKGHDVTFRTHVKLLQMDLKYNPKGDV